MFQNKATRGQDGKSESDTLWTKHENVITGLSIGSVNEHDPTIIVTSALDGRVVSWDLPLLEIDFDGLSV